MLWTIHPINPEIRIVTKLVQLLRDGEVVVLPTDTVYAFACLADAPKSISKLYDLKNLHPGRSLSLLCKDVAMASHYARTISNPVFRFIKAHTPGPYTFLLPANRNMDRRGLGKRKEVGIRIVDHKLFEMLWEQLDIPIVSTSITQQGEYVTDPKQLEKLFGNRVAAVIDAGIASNEYSTIFDCVQGGLELVRQGKGPAFVEDE